MGQDEPDPDALAVRLGLVRGSDDERLDEAGRRVLDEYVRGFLAQPNPELNAPEPNRHVCPFMAGALAKDAIFVGVHRGLTSRQEIEDVIDDYRDAFHDLEPRDTRNGAYKAILAVFPDVPPRAAPQVIDDVQRRLKRSFVPLGLMIGEFHPQNETPGVYNPAFRPMRSPLPMLAIRALVAEDVAFLMGPNIPDDAKAEFARAWLHALEGWDPDDFSTPRTKKTLRAVQRMLKELDLNPPG